MIVTTTLIELREMALQFPQTARSVVENINEQFGYLSVMEWTIESYRAAHSQFAGIIDAGEAYN